MADARGAYVYAKGRWRLIALALTVMGATALFAELSDSGHEPFGSVHVERATRQLFANVRPNETADVTEVAVAPDGRTVYTLVRFRGAERAVAAWEPDGDLRWAKPLNTSSAQFAAGRGWIAVTTAFPTPTLIAFAERDGELLYQDVVPGNPLALAADGAHAALAYQGPGNPVLVLNDFREPVTVPFPGFVRSIDLADGTLAGGTQSGQILAWRNGRFILNASQGFSVRSVALDAAGHRLVVGGFSLAQLDLSGALAMYELPDNGPGRQLWQRGTASGVSFVDVSSDGARVLAMEELPGRFILDFFGGTRALWSYTTRGPVAHADDGSNAGIAISPDGKHVLVAPLADAIVLLDLDTREEVWRYDALGATSVAFAKERPRVAATDARLTPQRPYDSLLVFDTANEPFLRDPGRLVPMLVTLEALLAAAFLTRDYLRGSRTGTR